MQHSPGGRGGALSNMRRFHEYNVCVAAAELWRGLCIVAMRIHSGQPKAQLASGSG